MKKLALNKKKLWSDCKFIFCLCGDNLKEIDTEIEFHERRLKELQKDREDNEYIIELYKYIQKENFGV